MVLQQVSFVERLSLSQRVPYRRFHCRQRLGPLHGKCIHFKHYGCIIVCLIYQHLKPRLHPEATHKVVQCVIVLLRRCRVLHDMGDDDAIREARFLFKELVFALPLGSLPTSSLSPIFFSLSQLPNSSLFSFLFAVCGNVLPISRLTSLVLVLLFFWTASNSSSNFTTYAVKFISLHFTSKNKFYRYN